MKQNFLRVLIYSPFFLVVFCGVLSAQVTDADDPGAALLDQATEAKLRVDTVADLSKVIDLCQRAKGEGLSGENLKYCNQLLASSQLQRGFFLSTQFGQQINAADVRLDGDWQTLRQRTLFDLEEAVIVIKDQPLAYLRIAQLNLLPDGDEDRAREALQLAIQNSKSEPAVQVQAVRLLSETEPDAEKRESILSAVAQNASSQVVLLYALTLIELDRHNDAEKVLTNLVETESDDAELHDRIVVVLASAGELELATKILDVMRENDTDDQRKNQIALVKADLLNEMEQHEDALELLKEITTTPENVGATVLFLLIRSNAHLGMDKLDEALKDAEEAVLAAPMYPRSSEQKFRILLEQEKYEDALAVVKRLQEIDESPNNLRREIPVLLEMDKFDEAVEVVKKLRETYPDGETEWLKILVGIYSRQKAFDKALILVEEQLKESPEELLWILAKASVYSEEKKWDEAIAWLESQLLKEPDSRVLTLALIGTFTDKKSYREAKERVLLLLEKEPKNLILLRLDSQLSISLGLHSEAVEALTKVVEEDPDDFTSVNNLAWLLCTSPVDSIRDGGRAVELAERAAKMTRHKWAFILSTLAAAYAEVGDFEKAREWSKASVEAAKAERGKTKEEKEELLEHLQKEWDCFSQDKPFREQLDEKEE